MYVVPFLPFECEGDKSTDVPEGNTSRIFPRNIRIGREDSPRLKRGLSSFPLTRIILVWR